MNNQVDFLEQEIEDLLYDDAPENNDEVDEEDLEEYEPTAEITHHSGMEPSPDFFVNKKVRKGVKRFRTGRTAGKILPPDLAASLNAAQFAYVNGRYSEAINYLSEVVKLAPRFPDPYHIMATIYDECGDSMRALQLFALAASLTPNNPLWLLKKVASTAYKLGEWAQALTATTKYLKVNAVDFEMQELHILALLRNKQYAKSIETLNVYLIDVKERNNDATDILISYGRICVEIHMDDLATSAFLCYIFTVIPIESLPIRLQSIARSYVDPLVVVIMPCHIADGSVNDSSGDVDVENMSSNISIDVDKKRCREIQSTIKNWEGFLYCCSRASTSLLQSNMNNYNNSSSNLSPSMHATISSTTRVDVVAPSTNTQAITSLTIGGTTNDTKLDDCELSLSLAHTIVFLCCDLFADMKQQILSLGPFPMKAAGETTNNNSSCSSSSQDQPKISDNETPLDDENDENINKEDMKMPIDMAMLHNICSINSSNKSTQSTSASASASSFVVLQELQALRPVIDHHLIVEPLSTCMNESCLSELRETNLSQSQSQSQSLSTDTSLKMEDFRSAIDNSLLLLELRIMLSSSLLSVGNVTLGKKLLHITMDLLRLIPVSSPAPIPTAAAVGSSNSSSSSSSSSSSNSSGIFATDEQRSIMAANSNEQQFHITMQKHITVCISQLWGKIGQLFESINNLPDALTSYLKGIEHNAKNAIVLRYFGLVSLKTLNVTILASASSLFNAHYVALLAENQSTTADCRVMDNASSSSSTSLGDIVNASSECLSATNQPHSVSVSVSSDLPAGEALAGHGRLEKERNIEVHPLTQSQAQDAISSQVASSLSLDIDWMEEIRLVGWLVFTHQTRMYIFIVWPSTCMYIYDRLDMDSFAYLLSLLLLWLCIEFMYCVRFNQ